MDSKRHLFYFILTGLFGIVILPPFVNFESAMAVGDHGLNFYVIQRIAQGDVPYRDFWWGYGPLAPYYYAGFFKLLGGTMSSVFLARLLLIFMSGLFCYLSVSIFAPPLFGLATALWFWIYNPDFFYSYNHTGAFTIFLALIYILFAYYKKPRKAHIIWGLTILFLLNLIRLNMGIALLGCFIIMVILTDRFVHRTGWQKNIKLLIVGTGVLSVFTFMIYWLMLRDLPAYAVHQCLPYFNKAYQDSDPQKKYFMLLQFILMLLKQTWRYAVFFLMLLASLVMTVLHLVNKSTAKEVKQNIIFCLGTIFLLIVIISHEFIVGVHLYRINWTIPLQMLFGILLVHFASIKLNKNIRCALVLFVLFIALVDIFTHHGKIKDYKTPRQFIHLEKAQVYVGNREPWIRTVEDVTNHLNRQLKPNEQFFAIPYEPMYYYLTGRDSPSWHVLLMKGTQIQAEQEKEMLRAVKDPRLNYVILSNRYISKEPEIGSLGETHLIDLAKYINDHFQTEATYGFWDAEPGWNYNHGVKILKRIAQ